MPARHLSLLNGLWRDGVRHDRASLRPLTGADELGLAEAEIWPAMRTTAVLSATLRAIGAITPVASADVRQLSIGDRERLLLALCALSFGPLLDAVVNCPHCAEVIEVPLDLDTVLAAQSASAPVPGPEPEHTVALGPLTLRFRLPSGADHEHAAPIAAADPDRGAAALRDACVVAVTDCDAGEGSRAAVPDALEAMLEDALRRLDPGAEMILALDCPACAERVSCILDAAALLAGRLGPPGNILVEVDRLARAYHWSEAAILALPTARRQRYLALLARAQAA